MKKILVSIFFALGISAMIFSENVQIITEQYLENTDNDIEVKYPQFYGLTENRDEIINEIIKEDIYSTIESKKNGMTLHNLYLWLEYEIEYLNDSFISIIYSGIWMPTYNDIGFRGGRQLYTINIDINQAKVIQLSDFLNDASKIYDLLEQDKFECVNPPDNIEEDGLFSRFDDSTKDMIKEELLSNVTKEPNQRWVRWYIADGNLVFGIIENRYLYKYSIALDETKEFLNADIINMILD